MLNIFVTAVLAFLFGMAVGIAGYCFTTLVAWEKEIEAIFQRMCDKYQKKIDAKDKENERLHDTVLNLQVQLARKEKEV